MRRYSILAATLIAATVCGGVNAQTSGDGVPDFYYFAAGGTVSTSFGDVTRPAGTMLVDSDGFDLVAMFIGGPDVTVGCFLCDGMNLPGTDAAAGVSTWTLGFSGGSSQWIRTAPLTGRGFVGVISEGYVDGSDVSQPWPADFFPFTDFPEEGTGLAMYDPGLTEADFDKVFDNPAGGTFNVNFDNDDSPDGSFYTNVTIVPEPGPSRYLSLALLGLLGLYRRI